MREPYKLHSQPKKEGKAMSDNDNVNTPSAEPTDTLLVAALVHAREMAQNASSLRMRNFNFFLILVGITAAAYYETKAAIFVGSIGLVVSMMFLVLDVRGREILDRAVKLLRDVEPTVWKAAALSPLPPFLSSQPLRLVSHTFVYRSLFVMSGIASLVLLIVGIAT